MSVTATATSPTHLMSLLAERAARGDVDALIALYEPDAVFEPQLGNVPRGIDQIRAALSAFAALRPRIEYVGDADCVIVDDIAIVANRWTMTGYLPDGSWLILVDQPRGSLTVA